MGEFDYKILTYFYSNWVIAWYCLYQIGVVGVSPFLALGLCAVGYIFLAAFFLRKLVPLGNTLLVLFAHCLPMFFVSSEHIGSELLVTLLSLLLYLLYLNENGTSPYLVYGVTLPKLLVSRSDVRTDLSLPYLFAAIVTMAK